MAGQTAGAGAAGKGLQVGVQALWVTLAGPAAKVIPVGAAVKSFANLDAQFAKVCLSQFRIPTVSYDFSALSDPEPTLSDFTALLKETGKHTIDEVLMKGREQAARYQVSSSAGSAKAAVLATAGRVGDAASSLASKAYGAV